MWRKLYVSHLNINIIRTSQNTNVKLSHFKLFLSEIAYSWIAISNVKLDTLLSNTEKNQISNSNTIMLLFKHYT